jgi:hypothetical protein
VSLLHDHLVFVTKFRRKPFTDPMLIFAETTMRAVCAELAVELVEFNGDADHVHLLVAYPPRWQFPFWPNGSKAAPLTRSAANTPAFVSAPACADISGRRPTSPSPAAAHPYRSSSNTSTAKPDPYERRAAPGNTGWAHPAINGGACAQDVGHRSVPVGAEDC